MGGSIRSTDSRRPGSCSRNTDNRYSKVWRSQRRSERQQRGLPWTPPTRALCRIAKSDCYYALSAGRTAALVFGTPRRQTQPRWLGPATYFSTRSVRLPRRGAIRLLNGDNHHRGCGVLPLVLQGSAQRGNGILQNEIYIGQIVWNKVSMVKDPTTGKRLSRPNPPSKHKRVAAPHLRIISDETWAAVRAKRRSIVKPTMHRVRACLAACSAALSAVEVWAPWASTVASRGYSAPHIARADHARTVAWSIAIRLKQPCWQGCARS